MIEAGKRTDDLMKCGDTDLVLKITDGCTIEQVGGKTFNISKLARAGFPIPEGFCITTTAYDYFMNCNSISREKVEEIGDNIRGGTMPPLLAKIIGDTYKTYLDGKPCAVRSSSPVEDLKKASFAGQYESFLNIKGKNALLDAVKGCWASLWSQSAVEYRKKMGIGNENIKMAVLVLEMVPATASGVLFTEDDIIIEAVWGVGDILVGGKVIPDRFVVERDGFRIKRREISHKKVMSHIRPTGGMEESAVPKDLGDIPALEDTHIQKLCKLGTKVEDLFGHPQDIEWALYNNMIVLLQARPISVKQETIVWTRANMAENQPGYVTYLSRPPENRPDFYVSGVRPLLECFGIKVQENLKLTEYIYGYVYVNATAIQNTLGRIPVLSLRFLDQSKKHTKDETPKHKMEISAMIKFLPGTLRVVRYFLSLPGQARKVIPHSEELIEDIKHRSLEDMPLEKLDALVWEMYERNSQVFQVHACTALAAGYLFRIFQKVLKRLKEEGTEYILTMGLEGMSSSQMGIEMWNLAQAASTSPKVSELILSKEEDVMGELSQFPAGRAFLEEMSKFTEKFGDRCSQELELSVPRWGENSDFVLSMVKTYICAHNSNPAKTMEKQKAIRIEATDRILKKLSRNPLKKLLFKKVLEKTQEYIVTRENLKTSWVKGISALRLLYLAIASQLVERETIQNKEDIFYMKMTEVSDIIAGNLSNEYIKDCIKQRKKEKEAHENLDVPMVIVGRPPPIEELMYTVEPKEILEGTGCSQGVVTGKARVILNLSECHELEEGEILVAPVTDPGWSPLFITAGGLVMELGSRLSHGLIIAREYGVPAVVGVRNATKIIKTGQVITVDGNKGVVYIRSDGDETN